MTEKNPVTDAPAWRLTALRLTSLFCGLTMLSSCGAIFGDEGVFRDRKNDYLQEKMLPALAVPNNADFKLEDELFVIPTVTNESLPSNDFKVPRPAPLLNAGSDDGVRIQKLGDERWILIELPPSHLWQRLKNFLAENRIPVVREEANQGLLETGWLKRIRDDEDDAPKTKERYRFRVEQGVQRSSTEVHVLQYQQPFAAAATEQIDWPKNSVNAEREQQMIQTLAQHLASSSEFASVSLLAQGIGSASRVNLVRNAKGEPVVKLSLPYERAWASLGSALKKADFNVVDLNRSEGLYYVAYEPKGDEDKPGFFSRMFGADAKDDDPDAKKYLFNVERLDDGVQIGIRKSADKQLAEELAKELLERVKGYLS